MTFLNCRQTERGGKALWDAKQPDRHLARCSHGMRNECALRSRAGVRASLMALTFASSRRAVPHATAHNAVHGAFMTLPPYTRIRKGEVHELGIGVRNCSRRARSRPLSEPSERIERECPATSAEGTARCASRGMNPFQDVQVQFQYFHHADNRVVERREW